MTTVINFNILNFFKPGLDRYEFHDARPDNQPSEEKQKSSNGKHRTIDVTQSSRVGYDESGPAAYNRIARQAQPVVPTHLISETYDRRGRSVQFISRKGLNIDSYV